MAYYEANYPEPPPKIINPSEFIYRSPEGYDSRQSHFTNFFASVRDNKAVYQNGTVALRAAAPALLSNRSYHEKKIIKWDSVQMKVI